MGYRHPLLDATPDPNLIQFDDSHWPQCEWAYSWSSSAKQ